jgi:hypothetical protein
MSMAKNSTPEELLKDLGSKNGYVRCAAAEHPNATPEVLLKAIEDRSVRVRRHAARNPNATPEVLLKAIGDKDWSVCSAAQESLQNDPILQLQVASLKTQKVAS